MDRAGTTLSTVSRRGVLVGAAAIGAAVALRTRPASIAPRPVPVDRSYPNPEPLTSAVELESVRPQLLDASPIAAYRDSHIPGARHVWWQDTMELNSPYYGTVLKPDDGERDQTRRQQLLSRWQLRDGEPIVVYDRGDGSNAARVAWFLRFLNIQASVLDGGYAGWLALETPELEDSIGNPEKAIAEARPQEGFYLSVRETAGLLGVPGGRVVDVRTEEERTSGAMAGRTAPGIAWLPRNELVGASGLILPASELNQLLTLADLDMAASLIVTGDTGLDTALPWLALTLMDARVTICDGGWQQWADLPELPTVPL